MPGQDKIRPFEVRDATHRSRVAVAAVPYSVMNDDRRALNIHTVLGAIERNCMYGLDSAFPVDTTIFATNASLLIADN